MPNQPAPVRTYFDPPERTPLPVIVKVAQDLAASPIVKAMLEAMPTAAVLLDQNRQIVAANARAVALFDAISAADVHGLRMGEAAGCVCSALMEGGCGTSMACAECGAAQAIRAARVTGTQSVRECRLTTSRDGLESAMNVRVVVTPMYLRGHTLQLMAIEDVGNEKRRETLERIFFHDVLGTGNAVHGLARMVATASGDQVKPVGEALVRASEQLLEEIQAQRDLMLAERGQLTPACAPHSVNDLVSAVHEQYRWSPLTEGRELVCEKADPDFRITTDRTQLVRCLGNLVRNALEAVADGERVTVSVRRDDDGALFRVANPGYIPVPLQVQIFQRSFSTKAARGRGLGTYSVRLIVQQYLDGRVSFASSQQDGTTFSIWLPLA